MPGRYGVSTCSGSRVHLIVLDRALRELVLPALPVSVSECRVKAGPLNHQIGEGKLRISLPMSADSEPVRIVSLRIAGDASTLTPMSVPPS
jgi:hypothetical protein